MSKVGTKQLPFKHTSFLDQEEEAVEGLEETAKNYEEHEAKPRSFECRSEE